MTATPNYTQKNSVGSLHTQGKEGIWGSNKERFDHHVDYMASCNPTLAIMLPVYFIVPLRQQIGSEGPPAENSPLQTSLESVTL